MKKVAAVHDISGCGRSSLTAVLPILSAFGIQGCPVPTAVLSTITGYFENYTWTDLTDTIPAYLAHWESLGLSFDSIYTGFLAGETQIDLMKDMIHRFPTPLVLVDPVFGDDGELYSTFDRSFVEKMKELVKVADVITPNLTEAAMLLGNEVPETLSHDDAYRYLRALCAQGPKSAVITGIPGGDHIHTACWDGARDEYTYLSMPRLAGRYPGTGDIFASVLLGFLLSGESLRESGKKATQFVTECIQTAIRTKEPVRDGLPFEFLLSKLTEVSHEPQN